MDGHERRDADQERVLHAGVRKFEDELRADPEVQPFDEEGEIVDRERLVVVRGQGVAQALPRPQDGLVVRPEHADGRHLLLVHLEPRGQRAVLHQLQRDGTDLEPASLPNDDGREILAVLVAPDLLVVHVGGEDHVLRVGTVRILGILLLVGPRLRITVADHQDGLLVLFGLLVTLAFDLGLAELPVVVGVAIEIERRRDGVGRRWPPCDPQ